MEELDLHGIFHVDVELEVKNFLFLNSDKFPLKIITGKSNKMREMVIDILINNNCNYNIPAHNPGEIIIYS